MDFTKEYEEFFNVFGEEGELRMAIEEMSELTNEICKYIDYLKNDTKNNTEENKTHLQEEIADVLNVIEPLRLRYGKKQIDKIRVQKMQRGMEFLSRFKKGKEMDFTKQYRLFVNAWGEQAQIRMAIEEMSELTKEICKYIRYTKDTPKPEKISEIKEHLKEEIADVLLMTNQLRIIFGEEEIDEFRKQKVKLTMQKQNFPFDETRFSKDSKIDFKKEFQMFIDYWSEEGQMRHAVEEMSELTKEICKFFRYTIDTINPEKIPEIKKHIQEETADVINTVEQLKIMFNEEEINEIMWQKIQRTMKKLKV